MVPALMPVPADAAGWAADWVAADAVPATVKSSASAPRIGGDTRRARRLNLLCGTRNVLLSVKYDIVTYLRKMQGIGKLLTDLGNGRQVSSRYVLMRLRHAWNDHRRGLWCRTLGRAAAAARRCGG